VRAMSDLVLAELEQFGDPAAAEIFFSAHGVPQSYVDDGDPYKEEMEHCVRLIVDELRRRGTQNTYTLAY
jgi:protoporphyrin/coproporphyrin ferrochelatase